MKMRLNKGGMETIIAMIIIIGLVTAIILAVVIPMSQQGDSLINTTTNRLVDQQTTMGPLGQ